VAKLLPEFESILPISAFPLMGQGDWLTPPHNPDDFYLNTLSISSNSTLASNIRQRRGSKVEINMPVFIDKNTPRPFIDPTIPYDRNLFPSDSEAKNGAAKPNHIYMDAMGFGMGCCCLQVTFQASNVNEARRLYDHLAPVCAILMSLSASTPVLRGYLADTDCRWNIISAAVDDRTEEERGLAPLTGKYQRIYKSRYATIDSFLGSNDGFFKEEYNDLELVQNEKAYNTLIENDVDDLLAKHIAHLFIRDPLVIYKELLDLDNENSTDHFENIQSTNWQNVRFKPPPPNSDIGWRVEFRPTEIQLTDFENAAYAVFIVLLTRAMLSYDLDFYIPITKMDINMERAHKRDAVLKEKFYFRRNVFSRKDIIPNLNSSSNTQEADTNSEPSPTKEHPNKRFCDLNGTTSTAESLPSASSTNQQPSSENGNPNVANPSTSRCLQCNSLSCACQTKPAIIDQMTVQEIMCGQDSPDGFPGLINIVSSFIESANTDLVIYRKLSKYLDFIRRRSTGEYRTNARYIRDFVTSHPQYKSDSVVNEEIAYDLLVKCKQISESNVPIIHHIKWNPELCAIRSTRY
ncbi:hypothetical protein BB560_004781, partial [Smittium megazygosporum]